VDCLARSLSEPKAFELIFNRHFGAVHKYLHRRAGRELADELAADTFVLAFERRATRI
jgi:DNA-directed RNA polymerase specialized sigma24 family protein